MWYIKSIYDKKSGKYLSSRIVHRLRDGLVVTIRCKETGEDLDITSDRVDEYCLYGCIVGDLWIPTSLDLAFAGLAEPSAKTGVSDTWLYNSRTITEAMCDTSSLHIRQIPFGIHRYAADVYTVADENYSGGALLSLVLRHAFFNIEKYDYFRMVKDGIVEACMHIVDKEKFMKLHTKTVTLKR